MQETELKLSGSMNNQLKYTGDTARDVLDKLYKALDLLGITYDRSPQRISQRDTYFDTGQHWLEKRGGSLRVREKGDARYLTLKKCVQAQHGALKREEFEIQVDALGKSLDVAEAYFHTYYPDQREESLNEILQVLNIRHEIGIATEQGKYALCFDKYEYYCQSTGEHGDPMYEIEVEQVGGDDIDADALVQKLSVLLTELMGFQVENSSKYKRGIGWLKSKDNFECRIFALFDFVAYSTKPSVDQRQLVRIFTGLIRPLLEEYDADCVKIPIGDGLILGFTANTNIIAFLNSFFHKLRQYNKTARAGRRLEIRTALHYGPIYEYTDINGNLNFAGSGINLVARIGGKTAPNQVLISEDCSIFLLESERINSEQLSSAFEITAKHNVSLRVRNYYDKYNEIGCPELP